MGMTRAREEAMERRRRGRRRRRRRQRWQNSQLNTAFNDIEGVLLVHFLIDRMQTLEKVHKASEVVTGEILGGHLRVKMLLQKMPPGEVFQSGNGKRY